MAMTTVDKTTPEQQATPPLTPSTRVSLVVGGGATRERESGSSGGGYSLGWEVAE